MGNGESVPPRAPRLPCRLCPIRRGREERPDGRSLRGNSGSEPGPLRTCPPGTTPRPDPMSYSAWANMASVVVLPEPAGATTRSAGPASWRRRARYPGPPQPVRWRYTNPGRNNRFVHQRGSYIKVTWALCLTRPCPGPVRLLMMPYSPCSVNGVEHATTRTAHLGRAAA